MSSVLSELEKYKQEKIAEREINNNNPNYQVDELKNKLEMSGIKLPFDKINQLIENDGYSTGANDGFTNLNVDDVIENKINESHNFGGEDRESLFSKALEGRTRDTFGKPHARQGEPQANVNEYIDKKLGMIFNNNSNLKAVLKPIVNEIIMDLLSEQRIEGVLRSIIKKNKTK